MMRDEIKERIENRMFSGVPFTFAQLHIGYEDESYRIADRLIQKHRKAGRIRFERDGRKVIWSMV